MSRWDYIAKIIAVYSEVQITIVTFDDLAAVEI